MACFGQIKRSLIVKTWIVATTWVGGLELSERNELQESPLNAGSGALRSEVWAGAWFKVK